MTRDKVIHFKEVNMSKHKRPRDKLLSIRVNEKLFSDCHKFFKNNTRDRLEVGLRASSADLVEFLLQKYEMEVVNAQD